MVLLNMSFIFRAKWLKTTISMYSHFVGSIPGSHDILLPKFVGNVNNYIADNLRLSLGHTYYAKVTGEYLRLGYKKDIF